MRFAGLYRREEGSLEVTGTERLVTGLLLILMATIVRHIIKQLLCRKKEKLEDEPKPAGQSLSASRDPLLHSYAIPMGWKEQCEVKHL